MAKRIGRLSLLMVFYILVFWIGFRSGEAYKTANAKPPKTPSYRRTFYLVEWTGSGKEKYCNFERVDQSHIIIEFFRNKNLRPILKYKKLKIFTERGERIY